MSVVEKADAMTSSSQETAGIRAISAVLAGHEPAIVESWSRILFEPARIAEYKIAAVSSDNYESLKKTFVIPIVRLLAYYLSTGKEKIASCYRDELLRYAPHRESPEIRTRFFREMLPEMEGVVVTRTSSQEVCAGILRKIHAPLTSASSRKSLVLLSFGDCLLSQTRVFLPERSAAAGVPLDMRAFYFSARVGRAIVTEDVINAIEKNKADIAAFSFLSYQGLPMYTALLREAENLDEAAIEVRVVQLMATIREFIGTVREHTEIPFLIHNASGLPLTRYRQHFPWLNPLSPARRTVIRKLNAAIHDLVAHTENCLLIDENAVAQRRGLRNCAGSIVPVLKFRGAAFHAENFAEFLIDEYLEKIRAFSLLRKAKVLLLDFDNTLWNGVMAEGEVQHYLDRQKLLKQLQQAGIVLVAVSKNDPKNIRWEEIHLQPGDFALMQINWDLKAQSIQKTAQLLDLGLDSFVFVDDNPIERDLVSQQLPKVQVLDALDPFTWRALEMLQAFPNTRQTEEAKARTAMYREQAQRREAMNAPMDYPALMASLGLRVRFGLAKASDLDRVSELVQRTNQFNTTTIRYSRNQLQGMLSSPTHRIYVADLEDRHGRLGLVLVTIVSHAEKSVTFDAFIMSCRAMGFGLESLVLCRVMDAESDAGSFIGTFVPTDRNTPAMDLFASHGFLQTENGDWTLDAGKKPECPGWFEVIAY